MVVDFDDVHVRDAFPDVLEDERVGIAHVRKYYSSCVHIFSYWLIVNGMW